MTEEVTSEDVASIAGRILATKEGELWNVTSDEIKTLAASCLTQAPDREVQDRIVNTKDAEVDPWFAAERAQQLRGVALGAAMQVHAGRPDTDRILADAVKFEAYLNG